LLNSLISSFSKSISNDYFSKDGASIGLFRIEILSGLTVALA
jgi:hypothetical protein